MGRHRSSLNTAPAALVRRLTSQGGVAAAREASPGGKPVQGLQARPTRASRATLFSPAELLAHYSSPDVLGELYRLARGGDSSRSLVGSQRLPTHTILSGIGTKRADDLHLVAVFPSGKTGIVSDKVHALTLPPKTSLGEMSPAQNRRCSRRATATLRARLTPQG